MARRRELEQRTPAFHLLIAALLAAGCGTPDRAIAPTDGSDAARPSYNFTNGPASPSPIIVRFPLASRVITTDTEKGLLAIHGTVTGLTACTDASTRVPVEVQRVATPSDAQNIAFLLTGEDNDVAIYDHGDLGELVPFDPAKFCPFIENNTPVYTGQVQYRLHINGQGNLLFQWVGFVTRTSDGARFHYVEKQYAVPDRDGVLQFIIEDISLHQVGQ